MDRLGANPAKFDLIAYGVDPAAHTPNPVGTAQLRAELGIPDGGVILLAVGRMVYKKGFDVLLNALALLPNLAPDLPPVHTIMVGEGDLWQDWQRMGRDLGLAGRGERSLD